MLLILKYTHIVYNTFYKLCALKRPWQASNTILGNKIGRFQLNRIDLVLDPTRLSPAQNVSILKSRYMYQE